MRPPGRPKGEFRSAQRGCLMRPPGRPKATTKLRRRLTTARSACDVVTNTAVRSTQDFQ